MVAILIEVNSLKDGFYELILFLFVSLKLWFCEQ